MMLGFFGLSGLLIAALALAVPARAGERAGMFTPACAERDLRAIAFIEQRGEAGDVPHIMLAEAGLLYLQARLSCLAGHEAEALATYDRILRVEAVSARNAEDR